MPKLQQDRNTNSLHVFIVLVRDNRCIVNKLTHGAMMILAPGTGSCAPSIEEGTWSSH